MKGHHLILGQLTDFITGEILTDTHDERYRQDMARLLVNQKEYLKEDIHPRCDLMVTAGDKRAIIKVDFKIILSDAFQKKEPKIGMIIKYGPGSLVTRQRPVLAMSRLLAPYQIPAAVITNGEDADVMDGETGNLISSGLESVPSRPELLQIIKKARFEAISAKRAELESRIVYAFEIDGACPCDDTVCREI